MKAFDLRNGDCFEVLKSLPDNSIDSVVTDPPYGMNSKEPDMYEVLAHWLAGDDAPIKGSGFMGAKWDKAVPGPAVWKEVFRVLKPGGHLLSFFSARTYDLGTLAIRMAGFEIRDQIMWTYGSGFPKSMDVSKAIDKMRTEDIARGKAVGVWLKQQREAKGLKQGTVAALWPSAAGNTTGCVSNWETIGKVPKWDQWLMLKNFIGFSDEMDAEVWALNGRKGKPGDAWDQREVVGQVEGSRLEVAPGQGGDRSARMLDVTAAASEQSAAWEGWGTALKPAFEPVTVARKPLIGTVAANVLAYGTGGMNISACMVATDEQLKGGSGGLLSHQRDNTDYPKTEWQPSEDGRWPANLVHDGSPDVVALFPGKAGAKAPVKGTECRADSTGNVTNERARVPGQYHADGLKSAARFFYAPKASKHDRNYGLSGELIASADLVGRKVGSAGINSARAGAGRTSGSLNPHPTVKPVNLMRWLVRLITPPGGVILDPFMGSGSTGVAAQLEGFNFVGIEIDLDFWLICRKRIKYARQQYLLGEDD